MAKWERVRRRGAYAIVGAVLLTAVFWTESSAQPRLKPTIALDAFGTIGVIHSSEARADYIETLHRSEGPGHTNGLDAGVDSRLAVQATVGVGSRLTGVVQVVAELTEDGSYAPRAEWLNLSVELLPDLRLRGGRIVLPAFLVSDSRKVSYANPWVRPPAELYGISPIHTMEGVDATWQTRLGEWSGSVSASYGHAHSEFPRGSAEVKHLWNVNTTWMRGAVTGRLGVAHGMMSTDVFTELFDGYRAFGPQGIAIAERHDMRNSAARFLAAGLVVDRHDWFTMTELAWTHSESVAGERLAGYLTAGVRWRSLTPYATYSRSKLLSEAELAGLSLDGLPPEYAQYAAQLNAGLNAVIAAIPVQQNVSVGVRWDFMRNVALKAQLDFIDVLGNSNGTFINLQPGFETGGRARLFSLATAFVL